MTQEHETVTIETNRAAAQATLDFLNEALSRVDPGDQPASKRSGMLRAYRDRLAERLND